MMSNEINLEELEALANAAGGVKWIACGPSYGEAKPAFLDEVNVDDDEHPESVCQYPAGCRSDVSDKMAYIAEANPATLLSLLDRLKSAEAERDALAALVSDLDESSSYWSEYDVPLGIVERIKEAAKTWKGGRP